MVQLAVGDTLRFTCSFQHKGAAYTGAKLHAAIGTQTGAQTRNMNEILNKEITITGIKDDYDWFTYTGIVDIPVTSSISPGTYEAYVKLMSIPGSDIFWDGPADDIVIRAGVVEFQNLEVSYSKA